MHFLPPSLWLLVAVQLSAAELHAPLPTAIRKMPPDAGEKFYDHYYAFPQPQQPPSLRDRDFDNSSFELSPQPAFAPLFHTSAEEDNAYSSWRLLRRVAAALERRDWACPAGTNSCVNIGYPNSCCQSGSTCMVIPDTGLGPVGCCPTGSTCAGTISGCTPGNTPCASELGGGCCIPGYVCQGVGCVRSSTATVAPSSSTKAPPPPPPPPPPPSTTPASTPSSTPPPVSTTHYSSASSTPSQTTTNPASAPVRPTGCPTGFYACLASAGGGCCQTGRDCQTTSCPPPPASTTIVNGDGVTVVVPAGGGAAAAAQTTGGCATGWFLCGSDAGDRPGCCPSGYACGTASCSLSTAGATASVAKEVPGRSGATRGMVGGLRLAGMGIVGAAVLALV